MLGNECTQQFRTLVTTLNRMPKAVAMIKGNEKYSDIIGSAKFYEASMGVMIVVEICGLPNPMGRCESPIFALHIHDGERCTGNIQDSFANAMTHYNPGECNHPYHAGDLPPIFSCGGYGFLVTLVDRVFIDEIVGKTIILHSGVDDFTTQPSGNSGDKIACGEIKLVEEMGMAHRL